MADHEGIERLVTQSGPTVRVESDQQRRARAHYYRWTKSRSAAHVQTLTVPIVELIRMIRIYHKHIRHRRFPLTSIIDTVANWKSLNNNLMRQDDASLGQVTTYSKPRSRGYRAGKKGDVKIPPPVLFKPFAAWPVNSVPFKCNLFPVWIKLHSFNRFSFFFFFITTYSLPYTREWTRACATDCRTMWLTRFWCWICKWWVRTIRKMVSRTRPRTVAPRSIRNRICTKRKVGRNVRVRIRRSCIGVTCTGCPSWSYRRRNDGTTRWSGRWRLSRRTDMWPTRDYIVRGNCYSCTRAYPRLSSPRFSPSKHSSRTKYPFRPIPDTIGDRFELRRYPRSEQRSPERSSGRSTTTVTSL